MILTACVNDVFFIIKYKSLIFLSGICFLSFYGLLLQGRGVFLT